MSMPMPKPMAPCTDAPMVAKTKHATTIQIENPKIMRDAASSIFHSFWRSIGWVGGPLMLGIAAGHFFANLGP